MINNFGPARSRPVSALRQQDERAALVEAVAIAATHYRHLMARYSARQAELVAAGVALEDLVTQTWEEFGAVSDAEQRLFTAVDALDAVDGLRIVMQRR